MTARFILAAGASLAALAFVSACQTAQPAEPASQVSYEMPHMKRPNLVVMDIERSLTVYRDILGFTAGDIRSSGKDSYSYPVFNFPPEAELRFISLHEPGEDRILNLTEATGIDMAPPPSAPFRTALVIGVTDLDAKFEQIAALGLPVVESKIAGGAEFRFKEQAFVDFDGHLIVCYEVLPDEA